MSTPVSPEDLQPFLTRMNDKEFLTWLARISLANSQHTLAKRILQCASLLDHPLDELDLDVMRPVFERLGVHVEDYVGKSALLPAGSTYTEEERQRLLAANKRTCTCRTPQCRRVHARGLTPEIIAAAVPAVAVTEEVLESFVVHNEPALV